MTKHDTEIRHYLAWRKKAKGKPIVIRLYEVVYVYLTMLWSKMGRPPLKNALHKFVERKEYNDQLTSCQLFKKIIDLIMIHLSLHHKLFQFQPKFYKK